MFAQLLCLRAARIIDKNITPEVVPYQEINTATEYAWGKELTQTVVGTGANALTTSRVYYDNLATDGNNYRRLKRVSYPGGRWEIFRYDQYGRPSRIVSQFKNNALPTTPAEEDLNRVLSLERHN